MEDKFYTIDQVAELLDMHHKTIRKFITEGRLRAAKVGKQWRISGHDLSLFMESNDVKVESKSNTDTADIDFSTREESKMVVKQKINVSTVIDINDIGIDEYMRISNTLIALMNCKDESMKSSTINMKYYEQEKRLKVMLWGGVKFTEEMLNYVSVLTEQKN